MQAVTQVLALACSSDNNSDLCHYLVSYERGSILLSLQDILQLQSKTGDSFSQLMVLRIMYSLIKVPNTDDENERQNNSTPCHLTHSQIVCFCQATIFFLNDQGVGEYDIEMTEIEASAILCCCLILSTLVSSSLSPITHQKQLSTIANSVINGFTSKSAMKAITSMLVYTGNNSSPIKNGQWTSSQSVMSNLGCYDDIGAFDRVFSLFSLCVTAQYSTQNNFLKGAALLRIGGLIVQQLQTGANGEISPLGTNHALRFLSSILSISSASTSQPQSPCESLLSPTVYRDSNEHQISVAAILSFANQEGLGGLLALISLPQHLELCLNYSKNNTNARGGACSRGHIVDDILENVGQVLKSIMTAISLPSLLPPSTALQSAASSTTTAQDSQKVLEGVYRTQLIRSLLLALKTYGAKGHMTGRTAATLVHVLSELVLTSSKFMAQFVEYNGLEVIVEIIISSAVDSNSGSAGKRDMKNSRDRERAEDRDTEEQISVCTLQISSHLARHSEKYFDTLQAVFTPSRLISLLSQVTVHPPHLYILFICSGPQYKIIVPFSRIALYYIVLYCIVLCCIILIRFFL